jgi:hypothetical protein
VSVLLDYDPTRDTRHRDARAAREMADWLAWLELGGTAPRTLSDYEWAAARILRYYPSKAFAEITDDDLLQARLQVRCLSRREPRSPAKAGRVKQREPKFRGRPESFYRKRVAEIRARQRAQGLKDRTPGRERAAA